MATQTHSVSLLDLQDRLSITISQLEVMSLAVQSDRMTGGLESDEIDGLLYLLDMVKDDLQQTIDDLDPWKDASVLTPDDEPVLHMAEMSLRSVSAVN